MKSLFNLIFGLLCLTQVMAQMPALTLNQVSSGFTRITTLTNCGDDRLFVVEKAGVIKFFRPYVGPASTTFMDINSRVFNISGDSDERGLLGLAFDPNYATNGRFYVNYINNSGNTVIARYTVTPGNPNAGDVASEQIILTITQPYSNHNGGCIKFGQDGYLYIGMGDGGSGGDPQNYSQNPQSLLGKMLRIDVSGNDAGYTIPPSNPFTATNDPNNAIRDEIWAIGVRNPWRWSFDRLTGDMWIADVGQNLYEEVNFTPASSTGGENYGWRCYEANNVYNSSGCSGISNYQFPVFNYIHNNANGCSITGGYVYRGNLYDDIYGRYFVTDYCSGVIWSLYPNGANSFASDNHGIFATYNYSTFGEDAYGEVYLGRTSGIVERITIAASNPRAPITADGPLTVCAGETVGLSTGYNPLLTYSWFKDDVAIAGADSNVYEASEAGIYRVQVSSTFGDTTSEEVLVNILPQPEAPTATAFVTELCDDASFGIGLTGTPAGGTFTGTGVEDNINFNPLNLGPGEYPINYVVTDNNGCDSEPFTFNITINALPQVSLSGLDAEYCLDSPLVTPIVSPLGGTLTGAGVAQGSLEFNPASAGAGEHLLTYGYVDQNTCFNSATFTVTVDACLSIENAEQSFKVLPNPFQESFQVQFNQKTSGSLRVFNALGKLVLQHNLDGAETYTANLNQFPAGVYFLVLESQAEHFSHRMVKY